MWANPAEPPLCPAALDAWLARRRAAPDPDWPAPEGTRRERPLFYAVTKAGRPTGEALSDKAVARLVKGAAAGDGGADLVRQTRHKSTQVALACLRPADLWRNNVTERVFAAKKDAEG